MSLKSFYIEIDKYKNIKVISRNKYKEHVFKIFNIGLNYKIAICSLNNNVSNKIITVDQNRLIDNYFRLNIK